MSEKKKDSTINESAIDSINPTMMADGMVVGFVLAEFTKKLLGVVSEGKSLTKEIVYNFSKVFIVIFVMKIIFTEIKDVTENIKLSNFKFIAYYIQQIKNRFTNFYVTVNKKEINWVYDEGYIINESSTLNKIFNDPSIDVDRPGSYICHYYSGVYLYVLVKEKSLTIYFPGKPGSHYSNRFISELKNIQVAKTGANTQSVKIISEGDGYKNVPYTSPHAIKTSTYAKVLEEIAFACFIKKETRQDINPTMICLNGPSGIGKTTFGNFLVQADKYKKFVYVNAQSLKVLDLEKLFTFMFKQTVITSSNVKLNPEDNSRVIVIDELDAAIKKHIINVVQSKKEVVEDVPDVDKKQQGMKKQTTVRVQLSENEIEEIKKNEMMKIMVTIKNMLDGSYSNDYAPTLIIINTNDIVSMFEGIDKDHSVLVSVLRRICIFDLGLPKKDDIRDFIIEIHEIIIEQCKKKKDTSEESKMFESFNKENFIKRFNEKVSDDVEMSYSTVVNIISKCSSADGIIDAISNPSGMKTSYEIYLDIAKKNKNTHETHMRNIGIEN